MSVLKLLTKLLLVGGLVLTLGVAADRGSEGFSGGSTGCLESPEDTFRRAEYQLMVDYILTHSRVKNQQLAEYKAGLYQKYAVKYDLPPALLLAMGRSESTFNPMAVSDAGAVGLMQIMPFWIKQLPFVDNVEELFQIENNIHAGAFILRHYVDRCGGLRNGVVCYHGGTRALSNPQPVTLSYVQQVMNRYATFL